ncbi:DUF6214 family protein [Streptomyces caniferus]|uniref:DUF6214 family protein n=1 Tax=Streptomyces caniferus TaxID=285557 RepID=UPI003719B66E
MEWPTWELRAHGSAAPVPAPDPAAPDDPAGRHGPGCPLPRLDPLGPWCSARLTFADGARVDVLVTVSDDHITVEDVRADPPLTLAGLTDLARWIEGPLDDAFRAATGRPRRARPAPRQPGPATASAERDDRPRTGPAASVRPMDATGSVRGDGVLQEANPGAGTGHLAGPAAEGPADPAAGPTAEPAAGRAAEPTAEPTVEPSLRPTPDPAVEPSADPTGEPAPEAPSASLAAPLLSAPPATVASSPAAPVSASTVPPEPSAAPEESTPSATSAPAETPTPSQAPPGSETPTRSDASTPPGPPGPSGPSEPSAPAPPPARVRSAVLARSRAGERRRVAADAYRQAQQEGRDPVQAVMLATGRNRRRSLRLIAGARDEGLLTPRHNKR